MKRNGYCALSIGLTVISLNISLSTAASAKNRAVEYMKYFNPVPQKNYLNESQDRLIKKQNFKAADLPSAPPVKNPELGFFTTVPPQKLNDSDYIESLLASDKASGISVIFPWKALEPAEEKYDWNSVDSLLSLCQKHGKTLILRVSTCGVSSPDGSGKPCSDTPDWVYDNGAKSVKYLDRDSKAHLMPILWDQTYLAAFSNFINEMGSRYDRNNLIHSIGITGGGYRGGSSVLPTDIDFKVNDKNSSNNEVGFRSAAQIEEYLRTEQGMNQKQIIDHWKYVADLFPKAFPNTRLNFAINPTTPDRAGEDALDEISDYLLFRYGEHIYITRQGLKSGKHGFDDYRVLLKFRPDTYTGLTLQPTLAGEDLEKISKTALDDGISFIEIPPELIGSEDAAIKQSIAKLSSHMGYQLVSQKASIPAELFQGEQLKAEFSFLNLGDTSPKRPVRELDKDVPSSYKVMIEIKDETGKLLAKILHTPDKKTETWKAGETISWQQSLRMPLLPTGEYQASVSLYDPVSDRKLNLLDGRDADKLSIQKEIVLGKLKILQPSTANKTATH